jgi:predicted phage tail protein
MFNIIIGLVFVIGGLSGKLALRGFNSPELLAAIGAVMIVWGITQVVRRHRALAEYQERVAEQNPSPEFNPPSDTPAP